jgi:mannosyltransferase
VSTPVAVGRSSAPTDGGEPRGAVRGRAAALRKSHVAWIVIGLTLLGAALRFATLDVQSIWLDESATMILVHRGFSGMLSHLASSESTPPLYYILVWCWTKLFGAGPLGFRSFSALAGTLTIPVLYAAGRQVSTRAGIWAAALAAVNPAMYYYSQEARAYALLILFCAAAFVFWQRALAAPSPRRLALWAGMSSLAVLTHYFAAFLFAPEAIMLARRLGWRRVRIPVGAVVLVGLALLPLAARQRSDGKARWIEGASLVSRVAETAKQFLTGLYGPLEIPFAVLAGLLAAAALTLLLRRGEERERRGARDAAIVAGAAIALPLALAVTHALDIFDGRNVIATWVPCAVVVAAGLGIAGARRSGALLGVGLCVVSVAVIATTNAMPSYQRDDWRGVARALAPPTAPRLIVGPQLSVAPLSIYLGALPSAGATVSTSEVVFIALRTRRTGHTPAAPVVPSAPPAGFRLLPSRSSDSFALARFLAPRPTTIRVAALLRLEHDPQAEVVLQR